MMSFDSSIDLSKQTQIPPVEWQILFLRYISCRETSFLTHLPFLETSLIFHPTEFLSGRGEKGKDSIVTDWARSENTPDLYVSLFNQQFTRLHRGPNKYIHPYFFTLLVYHDIVFWDVPSTILSLRWLSVVPRIKNSAPKQTHRLT